MRRNSGITREVLDGIFKQPYYQKHPEIRARVEAEASGVQDTESQRDRRNALVKEIEDSKGMVKVPDQVFVRITRYIPDRRHEQDDDNTVGGAKQLRDAVSELLSRKGDSEADGFVGWQIITETGPFAIEIEVFEVEA